jgi:hypothetical protein
MKRAIAMLMLAGIGLGGCTNYYKVTDPTSGKTYYTTELKQNINGVATLKDGRTGNKVTVQNSEIAKITKEEYDTGRYTAPAEAEKTPTSAPNPFK